jgi:FkbM family methyltransferase
MNWILAKETGVVIYIIRRLQWRLRKLLPFARWTHTLPEGAEIRLFPGSFFSADIYCTGGYVDWGSEQLMLAYLKHRSQRGVCYDVGANMGYYSVLLASTGRAVFAFEPDERNHPMLAAQENPSITVIPKAVGAKSGTVTFALGSESSVSHLGPADDETGVRVECTTLDSFRETRPVTEGVEVVKMDIEGFEIDALWGATSIAAKDRPLFLIEYNIESGRPNSFESLGDFVATYQYRLFSMIRESRGARFETRLREVQALELPKLDYKMLFLVPSNDEWFAGQVKADFCFESIRR